MEPRSSSNPPGEAVSRHGVVLEARLVHGEQGRRVVEVSAWRGGVCLGRSLGEGPDAEQAEDRALARLQSRLATPVPAPVPRAVRPAAPVESPDLAPPPAQSAAPQPPAPQPKPDAIHEPPADPQDWSDELAELDVQLQRLGWDRNQESRYLERAFGHPSRVRLTAYADLLSYLKGLRALPHGSEPEQAPVPLRRRDLLLQSDQLMSSLGWDAGRGRELLEETFQLGSRQQLSDEQLLQFNMLLETEVVRVGASLQPGSVDGQGASRG